MNDPMPANAYALPDGYIIGMPEHMDRAEEPFTLRDGTVVTAVRCDPTVDDGGHAAWKRARELERIRTAN